MLKKVEQVTAKEGEDTAEEGKDTGEEDQPIPELTEAFPVTPPQAYWAFSTTLLCQDG